MENVPAKNQATKRLLDHAESMSAAHALASALCASELVPADYHGKPDNGAAAILYGAEIGLSPVQALQNIFLVHGRPSMYARTMVAIVKAAGYIVSTVESSPESVTVEGQDPRTGQRETSTWTIQRAKIAGYTANSRYVKNPQEMLYAKAAAEVCRKIAPDVLLGVIYSREELELEPVRVVSERTDTRQTGVQALASKLGVTASHAHEPASQAHEPSQDREAATKTQLQKLNSILISAGIQDREAKIDLLTTQFKREFKSSKELTKAEADELIETLQNDVQK